MGLKKIFNQNTYTNITSSTVDAIGPIISTVPISHVALQEHELIGYTEIISPVYKDNLTKSYFGAYPFMFVLLYVDFKPTTPQREEGIRTDPVFPYKLSFIGGAQFQ